MYFVDNNWLYGFFSNYKFCLCVLKSRCHIIGIFLLFPIKDLLKKEKSSVQFKTHLFFVICKFILVISVLSCLAIFGGRETSVKTHFCGVAVKPELLTHSLTFKNKILKSLIINRFAKKKTWNWTESSTESIYDIKFT